MSAPATEMTDAFLESVLGTHEACQGLAGRVLPDHQVGEQAAEHARRARAFIAAGDPEAWDL